MEASFTLDDIRQMGSKEVINRYSALLFVDEARKGEVEDTEEWSHLALTK